MRTRWARVTEGFLSAGSASACGDRWRRRSARRVRRRPRPQRRDLPGAAPALPRPGQSRGRSRQRGDLRRTGRQLRLASARSSPHGQVGSVLSAREAVGTQPAAADDRAPGWLLERAHLDGAIIDRVVSECPPVGQVAVNLAHSHQCGAVSEHEKETVLWFPSALVLDAQVPMRSVPLRPHLTRRPGAPTTRPVNAPSGSVGVCELGPAVAAPEQVARQVSVGTHVLQVLRGPAIRGE